MKPQLAPVLVVRWGQRQASPFMPPVHYVAATELRIVQVIQFSEPRSGGSAAQP